MRTLFLFLLTSISCCWSRDVIDIEKFGSIQRQDIYVNGAVYRKSSEECQILDEKKYEFLKAILNHYERPFTMFDISAEQGYYTFRAASEFPESVFVMLEGANSRSPFISAQLEDICNLNTEVRNVIWLNHAANAAELKHLSSCEHFDVVFIRNITQLFPIDWHDVFQGLMQLAHILIIEEGPEIQELLKRDAAFIFPVSKHPHLAHLYIYISEKSSLKRTSYIHPMGDHRRWEIHSNFLKKHFIRKDNKPPYAIYHTEWLPGINLITYLMLGGQFPSRETISKQLLCFPQHSDYMLNNFIIQGNHPLIMIDCDDHNQGYRCKPELTQFFQSLILERDPRNFLQKMNTLFPHDPPLLRDYSQVN